MTSATIRADGQTDPGPPPGFILQMTACSQQLISLRNRLRLCCLGLLLTLEQNSCLSEGLRANKGLMGKNQVLCLSHSLQSVPTRRGRGMNTGCVLSAAHTRPPCFPLNTSIVRFERSPSGLPASPGCSSSLLRRSWKSLTLTITPIPPCSYTQSHSFTLSSFIAPGFSLDSPRLPFQLTSQL